MQKVDSSNLYRALRDVVHKWRRIYVLAWNGNGGGGSNFGVMISATPISLKKVISINLQIPL